MRIQLYSLLLSTMLSPLHGFAAGVNEFEEGDEFAGYYNEEELVSIATGTVTPLNKAPSVASVITRKQIEQMGATHLDEVLERVPGLHVMPSSLSRMDPTYSVRGIQTGFNPQIMVLLNGAEFKNTFNGGLPYTFRMPVSNIKRIEVIRGPGSAVYGADAFSGVINIITNNADDNAAGELGLRSGSFGSRDLWFRKGYRQDDFSISFAFEHQLSDGDNSRIVDADLQTIFDGMFATSASQAPGAVSTGYEVTNLHLDLGYNSWNLETWYWQQSNAGVGSGGANALDNSGYQDVDQLRVKLGFDDQLTPQWSLKANLSYLNSDSDSFFVLFPSGATLPVGTDGNAFSSPFSGMVTFTDGYIGNPRNENTVMVADVAALYTGFTDHLVRLASGWTREEIETEEFKNFGPGVIDGTVPVVGGTLTDVTGTADIYLPNQDRTHYYLSLQDEWRLNNDWSLTAGVRWDHYSDFGESTNPRIALVWETSHNLTTKLLYGTAFRAPAFNEQYLINNPAALGNPDLTPEEIETVELAFDYRPNFDTSIKLTLFVYEATDLIDTVAVGTTEQTDNVRDQDGHGLELELGWKLSDRFKIYGNYAFQHSENADTGADVADAPQHSTYLDMQYTFTEQMSASVQHYWIGSRPREAGDSRAEVDDYHWVNLRLGYSLDAGHLQLAMTVKNLFDSNAREPASTSIPNDYLLEERSIWGQVTYRY
ncbi:MAG: TonB-dependent receptor [Motiliproteus sp.]